MEMLEWPSVLETTLGLTFFGSSRVSRRAWLSFRPYVAAGHPSTLTRRHSGYCVPRSSILTEPQAGTIISTTPAPAQAVLHKVRGAHGGGALRFGGIQY